MSQTAYIATACALAALGWSAFFTVTTQSPGFNDDLLVEGVRGNTRLSSPTAMYNRGQYLHIQGNSYLLADAFVFGTGDAPYALAPPDVRTERFQRAESLYADSLRVDPSNGYVWMRYAYALMENGKVEGAMAALEQSWIFAPTTVAVARPRVTLVSVIRTVTGNPEALDDLFASDTGLLAAEIS